MNPDRTGLDTIQVPQGRRSPKDGRVLRAAIDRRLSALFPDEPRGGALAEAVRYAVVTPGKRIRPALAVLASWELGCDDLRALDPGCALEMVHAASLVLDDLPCMDDAPLRRGMASTHAAFGEDVAVLASITLLSRAFAILASAPGLTAEQRPRLVAILAEAVGAEGLAGGQFRDLRGAAGPRLLTGIAEANHLKTGALFVAAVEMAGVLAGRSPARVAALRGFAIELGQAFQILDDLADGQSGNGEDAGKATLLSCLGQEGARDRLDRHLSKARDALQPGGALAMFVGSIFDRSGREIAQASAVPA